MVIIPFLLLYFKPSPLLYLCSCCVCPSQASLALLVGVADLEWREAVAGSGVIGPQSTAALRVQANLVPANICTSLGVKLYGHRNVALRVRKAITE